MKTDNFFKKIDKERLSFYDKHYLTEKLSWKEIAEKIGTYPNKVRRDATTLGIPSRDRSEAQKLAISEGRHEHPTKGKEQSDETKRKISESQGKVWDDLDDEQREHRSQIGREAWDKKTDVDKAVFFKKSSLAIQEASRKGSKMELFIYEFLMGEGYKVERHKEHITQNGKFHVDLYLPACRAAIEIDGPMHFEPVFGEDKLNRRQAADFAKNGLILSSKMVLIRVKLIKRESQRYLRQISNDLLKIVRSVENEFPPENKRYFEI